MPDEDIPSDAIAGSNPISVVGTETPSGNAIQLPCPQVARAQAAYGFLGKAQRQAHQTRMFLAAFALQAGTPDAHLSKPNHQ